MTAKRKYDQLIGNIEPDRIYRVTQSAALFGYGQQRTIDLIESGDLPVPFPLSARSRFKAWTGQQILDHRAAMQKLAEAKAKAFERPAQPQPPALQPQIKKLKLRPPSNAARS
jgi:hypothetical protein